MTKIMPMRIYVAGPYTKGDVAMNVRTAIFEGDHIARLGHYPFIPHLSHFWHLVLPHDDIDFWYKQDNEWLKACDAIYRFKGESHGADAEVKLAKSLGLIIYESIFDIPKATT